MDEISKVLSKSIKEGKWVNITYVNQNNEIKIFWISIMDIDSKSKTLSCEIFNEAYSNECTAVNRISFERIKAASLVNFSSYNVPESLINKIQNDPEAYAWLGNDFIASDILSYYEDCSAMDNDPFQKNLCMIPGIDCTVLLYNKSIILNDDQFKLVIKKIIDPYIKSKCEKNLYTLALSSLAIDRNNRSYIVAYRDVSLDILNKTLTIDNQVKINSTFLWSQKSLEDEEKEEPSPQDKASIIGYIDMDPSEFAKVYTANPNEGLEIIQKGLHYNESINTRPNLMILERPFHADIAETLSTIREEKAQGTLAYPMQAFFGDISKSKYNHDRKAPDLVIVDKNINVDQMRVLYNSMRYPVTYVKGPPGTGKTQTLVNVVLSAFENKKTVLVCSGNNKPVDEILKKLNLYYDRKSIDFPFLRLGNNEETDKALDVISDKMISQNLFAGDVKPLNKIMEHHESEVKELVNQLENYQNKKDLSERIKTIMAYSSGFFSNNTDMENYIKKMLEDLESQYSKIPDVTNDTVLNLFKPIEEDEPFLKMLYLYSLSFIKELQSDEFIELKQICFEINHKDRVTHFNSWIRNDDNLALFLKAFPVVFTTNISATKLGSGHRKFDLVIMDEAGQCNVADSLISIERGKNLLLVGDESQLKPIVVLDMQTDEALQKKYNVDKSFSYSNNSIFSVMQKHDNISTMIFLRFHYRCPRKIIKFSNERFYGNQMDLRYLKTDGDLELIDVENENFTDQRNSNYNEAKAIVDYVKRNGIKNTTIITPFVNQVNLINKMLSDNGIKDIRCGTVHTMQGAENDVIVFSPSISNKTNPRTMKWINSMPEIINVGVTRAKKKLIVVADKKAIEKLSPDDKGDLAQLIRYVSENGNVDVEKNQDYTVSIGYSNNSQAEAELMKTMNQLMSVYPKYYIDRNVKLRDLYPDDPDFCESKQEFDEVVSFKGVPCIAVEVDGSEHYTDREVQLRDKKKQDLCQKKGLKLIHIPNTDVKNYEELRDLIFDFHYYHGQY